MAQQEPKTQSLPFKDLTSVPKLRKNRKMEMRWGSKYHEAVMKAVFTDQHTPYMPAEPPLSIREEIDKTGYVCKQCKDCFRFLSSIEEHTSRRSWVLGYWCHQCFATTCTHKTQGKSNCSNCIDIETSKHDYLLRKGIKKNLKKGITRIFYNQCQFFAHLRMHGTSTVDLSDVMLMPFPDGIQQEHYARLDKIWKAVMEVMFIRRIHIMDWIREKQISWNAILDSNPQKSDPVADIVAGYSEDCIGVIDKSENLRQDNPIQFEDSRRTATSTGSHGNSVQPKPTTGGARRTTIHVITSKVRKAEEKFVSNDIAFVDCGPTPNNCISESPSMSSLDQSMEFSEKERSAGNKESPGVVVAKESQVGDQALWRSFSQQYDKLRDKSRDGTVKSVEDRTESSSLPTINRTGPRVLTIRSPRSLSISTIMKHLPKEAVNPKKIVVVAGNSETVKGSPGSSENLGGKGDHLATLQSTSVDTTPPLVPISSRNDTKSKPSIKPKINPPNLLVNYKNKPGAAPNAVSQSFSEQMSLHGKVVFQNGRKYIIKHVPKSKYQSIVQNSLTATNFRRPAPLSMPVSVSKRLLLPKTCSVSKIVPLATSIPVTISVPPQKPIVINRQVKNAKILPKVPTNPIGFSLVAHKANLPTQNNKSGVSSFPAPNSKPGASNLPAQNSKPGVSNLPVQNSKPGVSNLPAQNIKSGVSNLPAQNSKPGISNLPAQNIKPGVSNLPPQNIKSGVSNLPAQNIKSGVSNVPAQNIKSGVSNLPAPNGKSEVSNLPAQTSKSGVSNLPAQTSKSGVSNLPAQNHAKSGMTKSQKSLIEKIRESLENDLHKTSRKELDAYIENLKGINAAYSKAMGLDSESVIASNLRAIQRFQKFAITAPATRAIKEEPDVHAGNPFEKSANDWELNMKISEQRICDTCSKRLKPAAYIVGISVPASDESIFCQCYNHVCYLCHTNQGSMIQLKAHIRWHKGEKPFMCPDCSLVFKSAKELEVHVWTACFHPMARHIYGCGVCEIEGILDMEAIAKHFLLLHTRRKIICSECKMEYTEHAPSYAEYTEHFAKHHQDIINIPEPVRLFLCSLKHCVLRPELFRAHLSDHIGVLKMVYYKCPFCLMVTLGTGRNKTMIREHLIKHHLNRLHEVVSADSLLQILKVIQFSSTTSLSAAQAIAANTSGPMIVNTRTITPASFEHGSESSQAFDDSTLPKILEVRSEAIDEFESSNSAENDCTMRIVAVESMAENLPESPVPKSEASDAMSQDSTSDELASWSEDNCVIPSSPLKDDVVGDDSSNSNDDMSIVFEIDFKSSPPKLERKPLSLMETNDESQEWNTSEEYQSEFFTTPEEEKTTRRPWRIALNSPTSVETTPVAYNCHLCGELINTSWSVVRKHFSSRHARDYELSVVSPKIPQISSVYIEGGYREDCNVRKRKPEGCVTPGSKRRRRWGPKKYLGKPGSPSLGLCVRPEPVLEVEGSFRCKKCDEPFDEIAMMREHIATNHRIKGQYLICLECGENFVVVPSLQMHLKALHGIQDPITYLTQNTAYAPDTPEDTDEEERTTEANQCYVCMAVFEDKAAVDKHIRVHGMAFLKRKRVEAQKAQKSWEKKGEPPDNSSNAVSPDNKSKSAEEASKLLLSNVEILDSNSNAGSSDDKTKNVQTPLKFWVRKFDSPVSSNTSASSDDKSHNAQDYTSATEDNAIDPFGMIGVS